MSVIGLKVPFPQGLVIKGLGMEHSVPEELISGTSITSILKDFPGDGVRKAESIGLGRGKEECINRGTRDPSRWCKAVLVTSIDTGGRGERGREGMGDGWVGVWVVRPPGEYIRDNVFFARYMNCGKLVGYRS